MSAAALGQDRFYDPVLVGAVAGLLVLGTVMVGSASISIAAEDTGEPLYFVVRHLAALGVGTLAGLVVLATPMQIWHRASGLLLIVALVLLGLVLVPGLGVTINGSTRWLALGPLRFQPSEPARLGLVLYLASYGVRHGAALSSGFSGFYKPLVLVVLACVLLLREPDFGAAVVVILTSLGILFVSGSRLRDFCLAGATSATALGVLVWTSPYRWERLIAYLDPFADPFDSGFQLVNSLIAIGRGGWFGAGLGESVQKLFYLPEAYTDFVFAVLAEELGIVGSIVVIVLFSLLVFRCLAIGQRAIDRGLPFQGLLCVGIGLMLGIEAFINIGVNTGLLPTKGLALPLISYGRSSLVTTMIALALVMRANFEVENARPANQGRRLSE